MDMMKKDMYDESEMSGGDNDTDKMDMDDDSVKQKALQMLFDKSVDEMTKKDIAQCLADGDMDELKMILSDSDMNMQKPKGVAILIGAK